MVTKAFKELLLMQGDISELNNIITGAIFYDHTSDVMEVNEARQQLFMKKSGAWRNYHQHMHLSSITSSGLVTNLAAGNNPYLLP